MAQNQIQTLLRNLRGALLARTARALPDVQLLERFVKQQDEAAFEVLVWRHGPMVLNLCRRILRHEQDAEDAFQATFLVLVCKAKTIGKRQSVGSWLYKVAYRMALQARSKAVTEANRIRRQVVAAPADVAASVVEDEIRAALDQEVAGLPLKYRAPVILCYLEGKSYEEAAEELGCPKGTLSIRLLRAREQLRVRLGRRGIALGTMAPAAWAENTASAALPKGLVASATAAGIWLSKGEPLLPGVISERVVGLTKGALAAMFMSKVKLIATLTVLVGAVLAVPASFSVLGHPDDRRVTQEAKPAAPGQADPAKQPDQDDGRPLEEPDAALHGAVARNAARLPRVMANWRKEVREKIGQDPLLKPLAGKYPLVLLHSRRYDSGGRYLQSSYSFLYETTDEKQHGNDVQLQFDNGGNGRTFQINMLGGQENLVADLGVIDFTKDPDPKKVSIDGPGQNTWLHGPCRAIEGHVYLERIRDSNGNNFYVLFQVVTVDPQSRYMAFVWRMLPGGKIFRQPPAPEKLPLRT